MKRKMIYVGLLCAAMFMLAACKHTHAPVKVEGVAETCTADGLLTHYQCSDCGKLFLDEACQKQTVQKDLVIPGGHIYGEDCDAICDRDGCAEGRDTNVQHTDSDLDGSCDICAEAISCLYDAQTNTYTVYTPEGLLAWGEKANNGANMILAADITMPEELTIDADGDGTMDSNWYLHICKGDVFGNGHTITGIVTIGDSIGAGGLASRVMEADVLDLHLRDVRIHASNGAGGIVGDISRGAIVGCSVTGTITAKSHVGGIAGMTGVEGKVIGCRNYAQVEGYAYAGGIVGQITFGSSVTACANAGYVKAVGGYGTAAAGIAAGNAATITACYNTAGMQAEATSSPYTGGVTVYCTSGVLVANFWSATDTTPANGNGRDANDTNATKVDGKTVTWATAMEAMNQALADKEIGWKYEENTGENADIMPLIPVKAN